MRFVLVLATLFAVAKASAWEQFKIGWFRFRFTTGYNSVGQRDFTDEDIGLSDYEIKAENLPRTVERVVHKPEEEPYTIYVETEDGQGWIGVQNPNWVPPSSSGSLASKGPGALRKDGGDV